MKTNLRFIAFGVIISLFLFSGHANATVKPPVRDSICCNPDSLKVISTNFPIFCVSWQISTDSICKRPYGFEIEWRQFPGLYPWNTRTVIYSGGTLITFCDSVTNCTNYQWRVRTICDTAGGTIYSDWIYGNKFTMTNCFGGDLKTSEDLKNKRKPAKDKLAISDQANKPKEN